MWIVSSHIFPSIKPLFLFVSTSLYISPHHIGICLLFNVYLKLAHTHPHISVVLLTFASVFPSAWGQGCPSVLGTLSVWWLNWGDRLLTGPVPKQRMPTGEICENMPYVISSPFPWQLQSVKKLICERLASFAGGDRVFVCVHVKDKMSWCSFGWANECEHDVCKCATERYHKNVCRCWSQMMKSYCRACLEEISTFLEPTLFFFWCTCFFLKSTPSLFFDPFSWNACWKIAFHARQSGRKQPPESQHTEHACCQPLSFNLMPLSLPPLVESNLVERWKWVLVTGMSTTVCFELSRRTVPACVSLLHKCP